MSPPLYTKIDDPGSGDGDSTKIIGTPGDIAYFRLDDPTYDSNIYVQSIKLYVRGRASGSGDCKTGVKGYYRISGGSWSSSGILGFMGTTYSLGSKTWNGLDYSKSQITDLEIRLDCDVYGAFGTEWDQYVTQVYVEVTYKPRNYHVDVKTNWDVNDTTIWDTDYVRYDWDSAANITMKMYDYIGEDWETVDSGYTVDSYVNLATNSKYVGAGDEVWVQFITSDHTSAFTFYLDMLRIDYITGDVYATIEKTINDNFLNRYDSGFSNYKKLYNITVEFDYRFTKDLAEQNDFSQFTLDGTNFLLNKDGSWHYFSESFEFDSTSRNSFDILFNISNGLLELDNMEYTIIFKCIDTNDHNFLQQDFTVEFTGEDELPIFKNYRNVQYLIYSSYTYTPSQDGFTYYNSYGRTNKLEIIYHIEVDCII
ncbi:hypothetical protein ES703_121031 [subsurface metagenome]